MAKAIGSTNNGEIFEYDMSNPWDISTASYNSKTFVGPTTGQSMFLNDDGTKLFIAEAAGTTKVFRYTLSTAYDISTATIDVGNEFDFSTECSNAYAITFKPDGTKMFITDGSVNEINEYTLGTAWDLTSVTHDQVQTVTGILLNGGMFFSEDGLRIVIGINNGIKSLSVTSAWTLTGIAETGKSFHAETNNVFIGIDFGLVISPDGTKFYLGRQGPADVYQFKMAPADASVTILGAEEYGIPDGVDGDDEDALDDEMVQYVYFSTENRLSRIPVSDIALEWNDNHEYITEFINGDDTYHPMVKQNNRLYIGDKYVIASIDEFGVVTLETTFNVREPERITLLEPFDTDLLVATKNLDDVSRVLRWDTESDSWYGQDDVYQSEIHAFIRDDNFVYALAGDSATAREAACANWLLVPTTKFSNVYLAFRIGPVSTATSRGS